MGSIPLIEAPDVHHKLFLAQTEHCIHVKVIATTTAEAVFKYPTKYISKFAVSQYGGDISELVVGDCYVFFVDQKGHYYPVYNTTRNEIVDPSVYGRVKNHLCLYESPNVKVNLGQI